MQPTTEQRTRRAVRAGGMSLALRAQYKEDYIPCTMTTNNTGWERGWFYLRNDEPGLPLHRSGAPGEARLLEPRGVSGPTSEAVAFAPGRNEEPGGARANRGDRPRLPPPPAGRAPDGEAAPYLRDDGDGESRRAGEVADASEPLLREYAATRARSAVDTQLLRSDRSLWDLEMLPTGPLVSRILGPIFDLDDTSGY
jgi:hypothetical protein